VHVSIEGYSTAEVRVIVRDGAPYFNAWDIVRAAQRWVTEANADDTLDSDGRAAAQFIATAFEDLVGMWVTHADDPDGMHGVRWRTIDSS
jgi:hypothetical protein